AFEPSVTRGCAPGMPSLCGRTVEGEWEVVAVSLRRGLRESVGAFDAEILHPAAQGARIEIQDPRRAAFAFDHPVGLHQHRLNVAAFDFLHRTDRAWRCQGTGGIVRCRLCRVCSSPRQGRRESGTEVWRELQCVTWREEDGAFDDVLQFSYVSGPGVADKTLHGFIGDVLR